MGSKVLCLQHDTNTSDVQLKPCRNYLQKEVLPAFQNNLGEAQRKKCSSSYMDPMKSHELEMVK